MNLKPTIFYVVKYFDYRASQLMQTADFR